MTPAMQATLAKAYQDAESDICDIRSMAVLAGGAMEELLSRPDKTAEAADTYLLPKHQVESTLFAVYHLQMMIERLHSRYYANFKDEAAA